LRAFFEFGEFDFCYHVSNDDSRALVPESRLIFNKPELLIIKSAWFGYHCHDPENAIYCAIRRLTTMKPMKSTKRQVMVTLDDTTLERIAVLNSGNRSAVIREAVERMFNDRKNVPSGTLMAQEAVAS
jgi:hypothetical protein